MRLGWGETAYHLRELLADRRLLRERHRRRDAYFEPGLEASERALLIAMQAPVPRALLLATSRNGEWTFSELTAEIGVARSVVAYYLRALLAAGLIGMNPGAGAHAYRARDPAMVRDLSERFGRSFERSTEDRVAELWSGVFRD